MQFANNTASVGGGGALAVDSAMDVLKLTGSFFAFNAAATDGGAVLLSGFAANATANVSNCGFEVENRIWDSPQNASEKKLAGHNAVSRGVCGVSIEQLAEGITAGYHETSVPFGDVV